MEKNNSNLSVFEYNNNKISFDIGNQTFINATEMAKAFGKRPVDWLRHQQSKDFISALTEVRNHTSELVVIRKGGNYEQGTWMHEDVALEFARWLSPKFAIWCNDRIKELLRHGMTATDQTIENLANNPDLLIEIATKLKEERSRNEHLSHINTLQDRELKIQAPKVEYFDNVMQSNSTFSTTIIAKELGMSAVALNKLLHTLGVQYQQSGTWVLYSKYQDKGFAKTKTTTFTDRNGETRTSILLVWTEKGRKFIHDTIKSIKHIA